MVSGHLRRHFKRGFSYGCMKTINLQIRLISYFNWKQLIPTVKWMDVKMSRGGGTRPENWWGCAAGRWKLDPKRSRKKLNLWPKRSIFVKIGSFCTPKDSFAVGGWEKVPQKDRARSCQSEKRGSKPRHICITHHIGSTPPPRGKCVNHVLFLFKQQTLFTSYDSYLVRLSDSISAPSVVLHGHQFCLTNMPDRKPIPCILKWTLFMCYLGSPPFGLMLYDNALALIFELWLWN